MFKTKELIFFIFTCAVSTHAYANSSCTYTISNSNWINDFKNKVNLNPTTAKVICFQPGTYVIPENEILVVDGVRNLTIRPTNNKKNSVYFTGAVEIKKTERNETFKNAPFIIKNSSFTTLQQVHFTNTFLYEANYDHKFSLALSIQNSTNITLSGVAIKSIGKSSLAAINVARLEISPFLNEITKIECEYFCILSQWSDIISNDTNYVLNRAGGDTHPAFWMTDSKIKINRGSIDFQTGQGLVGGESNVLAGQNTINEMEVNNVTILNPRNMLSWVGIHDNYSGLNIKITGSYPSTLKKYFCIKAADAPDCTNGLGRGHFQSDAKADPTVNMRLTENAPYTYFKLPPIKNDDMVYLNADGQYGGAPNSYFLQKRNLHLPNQQIYSFDRYNLQDNDSLKLNLKYSSLPGNHTYTYAGWLDENDYAAFGDFKGSGSQQFLTINTDLNGGAIMLSDINIGANPIVNINYWKNWSEMPANILTNKRQILTGNYTNNHKSQILVIKKPILGADWINIFELSDNNVLKKVSSTTTTSSHLSIYSSWMEDSDQILSGKFLGGDFEQVLLINTSNTDGMFLVSNISPDGIINPVFGQMYSDFDTTNNSQQEIDFVKSCFTSAKCKYFSGDFLANNYDQIVIANPDSALGGLVFLQFDPIKNKFSVVYKIAYNDKFKYNDFETPALFLDLIDNGTFKPNAKILRLRR